jgi:hypothetical protein
MRRERLIPAAAGVAVGALAVILSLLPSTSQVPLPSPSGVEPRTTEPHSTVKPRPMSASTQRVNLDEVNAALAEFGDQMGSASATAVDIGYYTEDGREVVVKRIRP